MKGKLQLLTCWIALKIIKDVHVFKFHNISWILFDSKKVKFTMEQPYMLCILNCQYLTHWGRDKWTSFRRRHFQMHFLERKCWISTKISLKFVPKGPINIIPALVPIMVWRRSGDKPLSEPMMDSLPTHICVTRPQWVNLEPWHQQAWCRD